MNTWSQPLMSMFSISGSSSSGWSRPTPNSAAWIAGGELPPPPRAFGGLRPAVISSRACSSSTWAMRARANCRSSSPDIGGEPVGGVEPALLGEPVADLLRAAA